MWFCMALVAYIEKYIKEKLKKTALFYLEIATELVYMT